MDIEKILNNNKCDLIFELIDDECGLDIRIYHKDNEIGLLELIITDHVYIKYIHIYEEYQRNSYATDIINHLRDTFRNMRITADIDNTDIAISFWKSYCNNIMNYRIIDGKVDIASISQEVRPF